MLFFITLLNSFEIWIVLFIGIISANDIDRRIGTITIINTLRKEEENGLFDQRLNSSKDDGEQSYDGMSDAERFRLLFDISPMGITTVDKKGVITDINKSGAELIGYDPDEIIGKHFTKLPIFSKNTIPRLLKLIPRLIQGKSIDPFEVNVVGKDGRNHIVEVNISPLKKEGKYFGIQAVMQNITKRKYAEKALNEQDKELRDFFNNANDLIQSVNRDGSFNFVNKKWKEVLEYSDREIEKIHFTDIIRDDYVSHCENIFHRLSQDESFSNVDVVFQTKSGEDIFVNGNISAKVVDGELVLTHGIFRDMTKQRLDQKALEESEAKLRDSEERLKEAQQIARMGRWDYVHAEDKLMWTDTIFDIFEVGPERFGQTFDDFLSLVHPEDRKLITDAWSKSLKYKEPYTIEHRLLLHDDKIKWVREECKTRFDEQGNPIHSTGIVQDVTDRKRAEAIKEEYQRILSSTLDSVDSLLMVIDKEYRVVLSNWKDHEWVPEEEREKRPYCYKAMKNLDSRCGHCPPSKTFQDGIARRYEDQNPIDGRYKEISVIPIFDEDGLVKYVLENVRDVTDQKKAEEELRELNQNLEKKVEQRTDRIRQLVQRKDDFINQLGHDLKNPLGPFMQLLPVLKNHVCDEKDKQMVEVLERNANYMRNLVRKTIDLAKLNSADTPFTFENIGLFDIIDEVISINNSMFENNDIRVINDVSSDFKVFVDSLHIQEVFTNLFDNAVKYMGGSGKITVDARSVDGGVLVSMSDTGIGISKEQLSCLFDEYYKADSSRHDFESSGLGLSICKRIIERHDGRIWAESDGAGSGSTFYFTLPRSEG